MTSTTQTAPATGLTTVATSFKGYTVLSTIALAEVAAMAINGHTVNNLHVGARGSAAGGRGDPPPPGDSRRRGVPTRR